MEEEEMRRSNSWLGRHLHGADIDPGGHVGSCGHSEVFTNWNFNETLFTRLLSSCQTEKIAFADNIYLHNFLVCKFKLRSQ